MRFDNLHILNRERLLRFALNWGKKQLDLAGAFLRFVDKTDEWERL